MKKICLFLIVAIVAMMLASCDEGNHDVGEVNPKFTKIHIDTHHFSGCCTIETWSVGSSGAKVKTKELGTIMASNGTYILVHDKCPICDREAQE